MYAILTSDGSKSKYLAIPLHTPANTPSFDLVNLFCMMINLLAI